MFVPAGAKDRTVRASPHWVGDNRTSRVHCSVCRGRLMVDCVLYWVRGMMTEGALGKGG